MESALRVLNISVLAIFALSCSNHSAPKLGAPPANSDIMATSDVAPPGTTLYIIYFKRHVVPDAGTEATRLVRITGGRIRNIYSAIEGFSAYLTPDAAAKMATFSTVFQVVKSGLVYPAVTNAIATRTRLWQRLPATARDRFSSAARVFAPGRLCAAQSLRALSDGVPLSSQSRRAKARSIRMRAQREIATRRRRGSV
jgi:hypothetical protein